MMADCCSNTKEIKMKVMVIVHLVKIKLKV